MRLATSNSGDGLVIPDDDSLLRRIPPWLFDYENRKVYVKAFANPKLSSGEQSDRFSVNWNRYATIEETLDGYDDFGLASITAARCRAEQQAVKHTPDAKSGNPAHCDVIGAKTAGVQKRLRNAAELLVPPTKRVVPSE